jgi:hypothetical protein
LEWSLGDGEGEGEDAGTARRRHTQHALQRLRTTSLAAAALARTPLPADLCRHVLAFLRNSAATWRHEYRAVLVTLPFAYRHAKRCTPCVYCQRRNSYSAYCRNCDARLWARLD